MTHKENALNSLTSAMRFLMKAETKKEGDEAYALVQYALKKYYDTMWVHKDGDQRDFTQGGGPLVGTYDQFQE
jgi:predicted glycosyltransferase